MRDFGRQRRAPRRSQIQEYGSKTQNHGQIPAKSENLPAAPAAEASVGTKNGQVQPR